MKLDIQRLRNLTTGRLHTEMGHIYEDLERISGQQGLMTTMLPRVLDSVMPWLCRNIKDGKFFEEVYDTSHTGELQLPDPTESDRAEMLKIYGALPNPLAGKQVLVVEVQQ